MPTIPGSQDVLSMLSHWTLKPFKTEALGSELAPMVVLEAAAKRCSITQWRQARYNKSLPSFCSAVAKRKCHFEAHSSISCRCIKWWCCHFLKNYLPLMHRQQLKADFHQCHKLMPINTWPIDKNRKAIYTFFWLSSLPKIYHPRSQWAVSGLLAWNLFWMF